VNPVAAHARGLRDAFTAQAITTPTMIRILALLAFGSQVDAIGVPTDSRAETRLRERPRMTLGGLGRSSSTRVE